MAEKRNNLKTVFAPLGIFIPHTLVASKAKICKLYNLFLKLCNSFPVSLLYFCLLKYSKLAILMDKVISKTVLSLLCKLRGHHWRYEDYSNCINEDVEEYGYDACRKCIRCRTQEYLLSEWLNAKEFTHQSYLRVNDY